MFKAKAQRELEQAMIEARLPADTRAIIMLNLPKKKHILRMKAYMEEEKDIMTSHQALQYVYDATDRIKTMPYEDRQRMIQLLHQQYQEQQQNKD